MTADTTVSITLLTNVSPKDYNVQVKGYLVNYTNVKTYTAKVVRITAPSCVCSHLGWDVPTTATVTVAVAATGTPTLVLPAANKSK